MAATTTTLHQCEIPGVPRSALTHQYSLKAVAEMEKDFRAALPSEDPYAVGVSVQLAPNGPRIQTLVLALRDQVFSLSFQQRPSAAQRRVLRKLFSKIKYLTGFEMPYTIVLLAHMLGSNISGYDLSVATTGKKAEPGNLMTPGGFLHLMNTSVSARCVNEKWDGGIPRGDLNSSGMPQPNHLLRAWFTAMYVRLLPLRLLSSDIRIQGCRQGLAKSVPRRTIVHKIC
jgi:hypothetical protein